MKSWRVGRTFLAVALLLRCGAILAQNKDQGQTPPDPNSQYVLGPDSLPQPGVPKGKTFQFVFDQSKIFPGTTRQITVYIPAEYEGKNPACVFVGLDAFQFEGPTVFDNLIYKREMPVTIGIGISAGVLPAVKHHGSNDPSSAPGSNEDSRFNRSFEFDAMNDNLARFLLEEIFPEVERHTTPDGLPIHLSKDPSDRAVGGGSTGGIGSFTLAWERPDAFRRVFIAIGTFVGMRGGDRYAVLVRKTEPKPIRIFMQDGSNDELNSWLGEMGDWWLSNQTMLSALEFAGYDIKHVWGEGSHDGRHATSIFPDAMRWLWRDWPEPISAHPSHNAFLQAILAEGENWQPVAGSYQAIGVLATDPQGAIFFADKSSSRTRKLRADGELVDAPEQNAAYGGLAFDQQGRVYARQHHEIVRFTKDGKSSTIAHGIGGEHFLVTRDGTLYATDPGGNEADGKVWLIRPNGEKRLLDSGLHNPTGLAFSPDGLWLTVAENKTHWAYSYRVKPDGTLDSREPFYWLYVPDTADDSGAGQLAVDREGRLYAATRLGVQVFDHNGRSRAMLPVPGGEVKGLSFGGPNLDILFVTCADHKIYKRKMKVAGIHSWSSPMEVPNWSPG